MERSGVPLVPGYHGDDAGCRVLRDEAARIGYPGDDQGRRPAAAARACASSIAPHDFDEASRSRRAKHAPPSATTVC